MQPVLPGTTKINKTGNWRTKTPIVDTEKCIGCKICLMTCPEGACCLTQQKNSRGQLTAGIDYDYCKGCGICLEECPVKAITFDN